MNARAIQGTDEGTPYEVLSPVLFNTFKHHAGALRARVEAVAAGGEDALRQIAEHTVVMGHALMDLYTGPLSPRDISQAVLAKLQADGLLELEAYRAWVTTSEGYAVVDLHADGSRWCLRMGDESARFVHLHPGRHAPGTVRVRANVLKTAFLAHIHAKIHAADPMDRAVINLVRKAYLNLAPLGDEVDGEQGLGAVIAILR